MSTDHYPRFKHPTKGDYWQILGWSKLAKYILVEQIRYPGRVSMVRHGSLTYERAKALLVNMGALTE